MSTDYFSHKPRSFLPDHHSDLDEDEKLNTTHSPSTYDHPHRGRRPTRLLAYQPSPPSLPSPSASSGPRIPRTRTLLRLLVLFSVASLAVLGWRCESFGCSGRGGGALVGKYVGGGSVVGGWGAERVDLSGIWERPSWGGEGREVYGDGDEDGDGDGDGDEGAEESGELVEWDDEEDELGGIGDWDRDDVNGGVGVDSVPLGVDGGEAEKEQEPAQAQAQKDADGAHEVQEEDNPQEYTDVHIFPVDNETNAGLVGELTGPAEDAVDAAVADAAAHSSTLESAQQPTSQEENADNDSSQNTWFHSIDFGLW